VPARAGARFIALVVTPGATSREPAKDGSAAADAATIDGVDPVNYGDGIVSDVHGRVTYRALIPGAPYRVSRLSKEFIVKSGELLDLGDIPVDRPPP
jgi:hypothetical protein